MKDIGHLIDKIDAHHDAQPQDCDPLMNVKCRELARGYVEYWGHPADMWTEVVVEQQFKLPILDPATGEETGEYYQGYLDKVLTDGAGKRFIMDHKTSSEAVDNPVSGFWQRWGVTSQASLYLLASEQMEQPAEGLVVDAIKKPGIRPSKADNGLEGYSKRLRETIAANPEKTYARQTVVRDSESLLEALEDMAVVVADVAFKREAEDRRKFFPKNTSSCFAYNSACKFLGVCSKHTDIEDACWEVKAPPEDGIVSWSNSRLNTYLSCPRKFYYEYLFAGHGVTRQENNDNLTFGSLLHGYMDLIYEEALCR